MTVLYSNEHKTWKIADFGLIAEATSKKSQITKGKTGTEGYRAPELMERGSFTNKVDIWALGCILHELSTGKKLFPDDISTNIFYTQDSALNICVPWLSEPWRSYLCEAIGILLEKDRNDRPGALVLSQTFSVYLQISCPTILKNSGQTRSHPSFREWINLAQLFLDDSNSSEDRDTLHLLAEGYARKGETSFAMGLLNELFQRALTKADHGSVQETSNKANIVSRNTPQKILPNLIIEECKKKILQFPNSLSLLQWLAQACTTDQVESMNIHESIIKRWPWNYWSWHKLYETRLSENGFDVTVNWCRSKMRKGTSGPFPGLILSNLYASISNYQHAIMIYMDMFKIIQEEPRLGTALKSAKSRLSERPSRVEIWELWLDR